VNVNDELEGEVKKIMWPILR